MTEVQTNAPVNANGSAAKAWLRALELTAPIARNPNRVMSTVMEDLAARSSDAPALLSDRECLTYRELAERSNRYARWALKQGLAKGEVVCLLMTNRPEYFVIWLGITSVGGVVALLNTNLVGSSLAHCINIVSPKHLIVDGEFVDALTTALPSLSVSPEIWAHGVECASYQRIDLDIEYISGDTLSREERRPLTIEDRALYIFTSGTTGLPKAANISHARVLQWSHWFAGMMGAQQTDRMYNCLPMYHSIGGVLVPGAALVGGGSVVIREKFSASQFWADVIRWDCTMFQYIGELCRYLLHAAPSSNERSHRIRMACGNGLASEVWEDFKERFQIPQILEFYASTEGGVSLFNVQGKPGAIGHIPTYLAHRFSPPLVVFDVEKGKPVRNDEGFCIRCAPNEIGEAIGKVVNDLSNIGGRFEGYTDKRASNEKILRDVFELGDAWVRTGDLMRKDEKGFFYFVDRIGDTFRWKGENVATSEVSEAICTFPGVKHANVYGVAIPGTEGRGGMAALVTEHEMDLPAFRRHLMSRLPAYARPLFLRIRDDIEVTGTFKYSKTDLVRQGYDPVAITDVVYFDSPESEAFVQLDKVLYDRIQDGQIRL
ncbi:fatty-acyl-CoA synthase [Edaphobacter aggregans]|uniref:Fatty-acyl-CoA synthase n=1 Tax=Edaphobacter aggregans TaxID=570835 RepID=A0A428MKG1_9BACT|nr:long-chain-acyl-CoA synthetase [Edaphobacter aggregans]RSL17398.1 fatty-acyl-CoA synthase [Edaphobacter aggregans]